MNKPAASRRLFPSMTGLRVFEAAARHLSFTQAGTELGLTQSAVSRQIRALEELLDIKLFRRIQQRLALTTAASTYLPDVRACLSQIEAATLELLAHRGAGGVLNLAILPTFGTKWLIPRMAGFWKRCPHITVNFTTRPMAFDFQAERLDAAIHFGDASWPGVVAHRLMGEEVVVVCSPDLVRNERLRSPTDLADQTLLQHTTRPHAWEDWLRHAGVDGVASHSGPRFEHLAMVEQAAIAGIGVAVMPRFLVEDEITAGSLVIPFDLPVRSEHSYYLVHPQEKADLPALKVFLEWLLDQVREETSSSARAPDSVVHREDG